MLIKMNKIFYKYFITLLIKLYKLIYLLDKKLKKVSKT